MQAGGEEDEDAAQRQTREGVGVSSGTGVRRKLGWTDQEG